MKQIWAMAGALLGLLAPTVYAVEPRYVPMDQPPHNYWASPLKDKFTKFKDEVEAGLVQLDSSSEKAFLIGLLKALNIPASSQMLVFSTTSLQLRLISPSNPRALYFNEDVYVGFIPGGRIEILSLDPELGGIYYIFDIPRNGQPLLVERSDRCMRCHAVEETDHVPGMVIKSVIPGPGGGSLTAYRLSETGHSIPFEQRLGGWYVTGISGITNHLGNLTGRLSSQGLTKYPLEPGKYFSFARYPVSTSDILPQLLQEHQAGFVNRAIEAAYRAREYTFASQGKLTTEQATDLDKRAGELTRYLLFADEVPLPTGGVEGDAVFKQDFLSSRKPAKDGASLKDFDLHTRLFKYRCSYMIYGATFQGLAPEVKQRVYRNIGKALDTSASNKEYAYLPTAEKRAIHRILKETIRDLPRNW